LLYILHALISAYVPFANKLAGATHVYTKRKLYLNRENGARRFVRNTRAWRPNLICDLPRRSAWYALDLFFFFLYAIAKSSRKEFILQFCLLTGNYCAWKIVYEIHSSKKIVLLGTSFFFNPEIKNSENTLILHILHTHTHTRARARARTHIYVTFVTKNFAIHFLPHTCGNLHLIPPGIASADITVFAFKCLHISQ